MQFLGFKKWFSANIFSDTKQKHVCWKIYEVERFFAVLWEDISMSNELRFAKWLRFFEWNSILRYVIFSASFCWLWDFLLENLKLKKKFNDVHWNVWTNIKTLYPRNNIFKKRIPNMRFWIIYIWSKYHFFGTALSRFSQCFF